MSTTVFNNCLNKKARVCKGAGFANFVILETRSPNPPDNNPGGNNGVGGMIAVHIVPIALSKNIGYSMAI